MADGNEYGIVLLKEAGQPYIVVLTNPTTGGVTASNRAVSPDWAKPYYPADPGSLILPVNWTWFFPEKQWISDTYAHIVQGA
jgi:hypothetical protein